MPTALNGTPDARRAVLEARWRDVELVLAEQSGVIAAWQIPPRCAERARWRCESGRWQRPHPGVFVAHSGPVTRLQRMWVGVLAGGPDAALTGATAAELAGLCGFERDVIQVALPDRRGPRVDGVRYRMHPELAHELMGTLQPPRVRPPVAVLEMAAAARDAAGAHRVLTAAAQQGIVRTAELRAALDRRPKLRQRAVIRETLLDIDDGAQSLNEVAMLRLCARSGLPRPVMQVIAPTARRRSRIDGGWPDLGVFFEIDGAGHFTISKWIDDADRHNEVALATPVGAVHLRWPGFAVRRTPDRVADQAVRALKRAGW
jgi:hypothetical protein